MAELSPDDVQSYTNGQLSSNDDETARMLSVALATARRDVRWYVSPMVTETIILNGTGTQYLRLPTKQVINITSITSDGNTVDPVNGVVLDPDSGNLLVMAPGQVWSSNYRGVSISWTHGFPETTSIAANIAPNNFWPNGYTGSLADDWRQAILNLVVSLAQITYAGRPDYELASKGIDDITYRWGATASLASIEPILAKYRILSLWV